MTWYRASFIDVDPQDVASIWCETSDLDEVVQAALGAPRQVMVQQLVQNTVSRWEPLSLCDPATQSWNSVQEQMADALKAQARHVVASQVIDRRGWERSQWLADAREQFQHEDGSVLDLCNGHVSAMLEALADVQKVLQRVVDATGTHQNGMKLVGTYATALDDIAKAVEFYLPE